MAWKWFWNTETKYYDGEITRDTDWGGDASTDNQPVSGGRVQEWLKNEINGKFGVARMSQIDPNTNFYSIELFATAEEEKAYDELDDKDSDDAKKLVTRLTIPISAVQGDSYSARLYTDIPQNNIVVSGSDFNVPLRFNAIRYSNGAAEDAGARGTLQIQRSTDNGTTWNDVATLKNQLASQPSTDTDFKEDDVVNIGGYLANGKQFMRVRASFEYEDITTGDLRTAYSSWVTVGSSVTKTTLELELITPYHTPMYATNEETGAYNNLAIEYRVYGAVDKTLFVEVEGSLGKQTVEVPISAISNGETKGISLPYSEAYGFHTHGVKKAKAWVEAQDGLGNTIKSNELNTQFMMVADTANTQKYLLLQNVVNSVTNYIQTEMAEYAVYAPDGSETELSFQVQDTKGNVYTEETKKVVANTANEILATVEIEPTDEGSVPEGYATRFYVFNGSDNMIASSGLNKYGYYDVYVDNKDAVVPVLGATFLMNPKSRDNGETDPLRILNAKANNAAVPSEWKNADLINGTWITDDNGQKVLRIMAGTTLTIKRNIWKQFLSTPDSALTFEIDYKVSNVTDTDNPIVQVKGGSGNKGIVLNALKGWVRTSSYTNDDNCMFAWREGQRQFLSVNLHNNVQPFGDGVIYPSNMEAQAKSTIALARVLLNGDPVREIPFDRTKAGEWCDDENAAIIIGGNEGADIDVYSIRVYENKAIDWADLQQKNYPSSMATTDEKLNFLEMNAIRLGRYISLEETRKKGLNCIVYHARRPYIHEKTSPDCWIEYHRYDQNGNYLPEFSGKNCEETVKRYRAQAKPDDVKTLSVEGQGSTAKTYYDWNIQDNNSKVTATIQVAVTALHESISCRIEGDQAYLKGGNLGKNFPYEETEVAYPYANGFVNVPDGWIDGNGKYRGMGYMVAENTTLAQKKVAKINYASSMQSHLLGACKSYDELHFLCAGATPLQQAYLDKGLTRPVLAKHTEPFMMFWEENGVTTFTGLCVYGAAKMDKVAFGYVKKLMPMYSMIEGSDNNLPLTDFRVPFDDEVKTALKDGEMDGWTYNGETSFDYDAGATSDDDQDASPEIRKMWGKYHNFIYLNSTNIKVYDGSVDEFKLSEEASKNITSKYWCTTGSKAFHLMRYDFLNSQWVDAGLKGADGKYSVVDLKTDLRTKAVYEQYKSSTAYDEINNAFKKVLADFFKAHGKFLMSMKSLLFNYSYVLGFLAGTDNSSKNTYYVIDPIVQDMSGEANDDFSAWYLATFGESFDYTKCYLMYMAGDDMDSILPVNNMGNLTKPYYIERLYPYADGKTECLYEGINNSLFNLVEAAFTFDERSAMMNSILTKMQSLVSNEDNLLALKDNKQSVWGFLHKYFFNVQYYFPKIAYLEQARIRYEFAEVMGHTGARGVRPISQSVGSNVENEMQFMEQRVVYMASFAEFGSLGNNQGSIGITDTTDQFAFRGSEMPDRSPATFTFTLTPHQYMYPCGFFGETHKPSRQRTSPKQTCTITIASSVVGTPDAQMGIRGINYISDLGDLGDKSITTPLTINGKRLTNIFESASEILRASSINIEAPNTKEIRFTYSEGLSNLDLSKQIRLRRFCWYRHVLTNLQLPKSNNLREIIILGAVVNLNFQDIPNLQSLAVDYKEFVKSFIVNSNVGTNVEDFTVQPIVEGIWDTQKSSSSPALQSIHVENINWTYFDVSALSWFADRPACELFGNISLDESSQRMTWAIKNKMLHKFGDVDSGNGNLTLAYAKTAYDNDTATLKGNFFADNEIVYTGSKVFPFAVNPYSVFMNNQTSVKYSLECSKTGHWSMDEQTGELTVDMTHANLDSDTKAIVKATVKTQDGATYEKTKEINFWKRPARVGDLVYYDGTYAAAATDNDEKTSIGTCIYVAPRDENGNIVSKYHNPKDVMTRIMVSLTNVSASSTTEDFSSWEWGAFPIFSQEDDPLFADKHSLYAETVEDGQVVRKNLSLDGDPAVSTIYDVPNLRNLASSGLYEDGSSTFYITDKSFRDTGSEEVVKYNDGFKPIAANYAMGDGFAYNEPTSYLAERTLSDKDSVFKALAGSTYADMSGDVVVNSGYAKTLRVIAHRNNILRNGLAQIGLTGENSGNGVLTIPTGADELGALAQAMSNLRAWAKSEDGLGDTAYGNKWSQLYYPAASACYAYEPKVKDGEVLDPKFTKHHWFLMPEGLIGRLNWYLNKYTHTYDDSNKKVIIREDRTDGPLQDAILKGKFVNNFSTSYLWSVTEVSSTYSWHVNFLYGNTSYNLKGNSVEGRAVSAF